MTHIPLLKHDKNYPRNPFSSYNNKLSRPPFCGQKNYSCFDLTVPIKLRLIFKLNVTPTHNHRYIIYSFSIFVCNLDPPNEWESRAMISFCTLCFLTLSMTERRVEMDLSFSFRHGIYTFVSYPKVNEKQLGLVIFDADKIKIKKRVLDIFFF